MMRDGKLGNVLFGKNKRWLWVDKTTIGSMNRVYMDGRMVPDTFGLLTVSKQQFWSLIDRAATASIQL